MLRVTVIQSARRTFDGTARQVVLPGEAGEVSILDCHAPMVCVLAEGEVQIDDARIPIRGGLARVERNDVTVVA